MNARSKDKPWLLAGKGLSESLGECNEHRKTSGFEVAFMRKRGLFSGSKYIYETGKKSIYMGKCRMHPAVCRFDDLEILSVGSIVKYPVCLS